MMDRLAACPVCLSKDLKFFLSCKDYTVSHETFNLEQCQQCEFVLTNPQPTEADIGRYYDSSAYISHSDNSFNLIDKVYKLARKFTLRWKYNLIKTHHFKKPLSILDYGCGTGAFLQECQNHKMEITGVEPSPVARPIAIKNTHARIFPDISHLDHQYDVITMWHVLEHVSDFHGTLEKLKDHLTKDGTMFIAVPNLNSQDARQYQEYWAAFDVPRHLWHFSKKNMQQVLKSHALHLSESLPMRLDSYYVSLLSEKYKRGNNSPTGLATAMVNAWKSNHAASKSSEYSSQIYIARK